MAKNRYIVIRGNAENSTEAIQLCGKALEQAGIVSASFAKGCIERETEYPTGLPTEIPTAIPHCQDSSVKENAICVLFPDKPITFRRMDDDEESVDARILFNLAVMNPDEHLEALQNLMAFLGDTEALEACLSKTDDELIPYLEEKIG